MTLAPAGDWPDTDRLRAACDAAAVFYERALRSADPAWAYMAERGWAPLTEPGPEAARWRPGYAADRVQTLVTHLRMAGFTEREVIDSGLGRRARWGVADRFRHRIVFPLVDDRSVIGFVGRALPGSPPEAPKWLNSPTTPLYEKNRHLFGLHQNTDRWGAGAVPVLVEGAGDAIAVSLAGRAAVAPLGTALNRDQLAELDRHSPPANGVVVAFDSDRAGRRATLHVHRLIAGRTATAASLPDGADPGDYASQHRLDGLRRVLEDNRLLAAAVIDIRLADWDHVLDHPAGRINAVRDVSGVVLVEPRRAAQLIGQVAYRVGLASREVSALVVESATSSPGTLMSAALDTSRHHRSPTTTRTPTRGDSAGGPLAGRTRTPVGPAAGSARAVGGQLLGS